MKVKFEYAIFAVFAVLLVIGCWNVYFNEHQSYGVSLNGDGFTVTGPPSEYRYSVYSDTDVPDKLYLYLDERYPSDLNSYYQQSEFLGVLKKMLEDRGMKDIQYVDADSLKDVLTGDCAVFFVSGNLPDTVYDGTDTCIMVQWLKTEGKVFWTGPEFGRYVASTNGITDLGEGLFGGKVCSEKDKYGYTHSEMYQYTTVRLDDCTYGLSTDIPDSLPLGYVTDDGYSAVSVAKLYASSVTVFGGNIAATETVLEVLTDRTYCSEIVVSGLTYQSKGLTHGSGSLNGSANVGLDLDLTLYTSASLSVFTGEPASNWGRTVPLI